MCDGNPLLRDIDRSLAQPKLLGATKNEVVCLNNHEDLRDNENLGQC